MLQWGIKSQSMMEVKNETALFNEVLLLYTLNYAQLLENTIIEWE